MYETIANGSYRVVVVGVVALLLLYSVDALFIVLIERLCCCLVCDHY